MLSQCSIATTAAESTYRINQPNSLPRTVKAIFLDENINPCFSKINNKDWDNLELYTIAASDKLELIDAGGKHADLEEFTKKATLIILLTSECQRTDLASALGEYFNRNNRMPTLFLLENGDADKTETLHMLIALRPYVSMLVHSTDDSYLPTLLSALRA